MRRGLFVGINDYPNSPLNGCVNDALSLSATLECNGDGSPNFSTKNLTAPGDAVTRPSLRKAIKELFDGDPDMALFYFSGHGFIKSHAGYIVTQDAVEYDEGVSMEEILRVANASAAKNKIVILDCCHAGAFAKPNLPGGAVSQLSDGLSVLTASTDDQAALEVNGAGVFTSLLIDALKGGAADLRGNITPGSLYAYVDEALGAWDQRPVFKTNVSSFAAIRLVPPPVPAETMRRLIEYFDTPESHHDLDPSYEFTDPSAVPENVEILKELQKFQSVGLVVPVDAEFMYFAAMNSTSCKLTALGYQYWRLVKEKRL